MTTKRKAKAKRATGHELFLKDCKRYGRPIATRKRQERESGFTRADWWQFSKLVAKRFEEYFRLKGGRIPEVSGYEIVGL